MAGRAVFVDTVALLALANRRDALHGKAVQILNQLAAESAELIVSDWIFTEFLGGAAGQALRGAAVRIIARLRQSPHVRVLPATHADWREAFNLFRELTDKEWSLVDCASILFCRQEGVMEVFTHDHHFVQAGFRILL